MGIATIASIGDASGHGPRLRSVPHELPGMPWRTWAGRSSGNQFGHQPRSFDFRCAGDGANEKGWHGRQSGNRGGHDEAIKGGLVAATTQGRSGHAVVSPPERTRDWRAHGLPKTARWGAGRRTGTANAANIASSSGRTHRQIHLPHLSLGVWNGPEPAADS